MIMEEVHLGSVENRFPWWLLFLQIKNWEMEQHLEMPKMLLQMPMELRDEWRYMNREF